MYGDLRPLQASGDELPAGGMLLFQETNAGTAGASVSALYGGDVDIVGGPGRGQFGRPGVRPRPPRSARTAFSTSPPRALTPPFPRPDWAFSTCRPDTLSGLGLGQLTFQTSGALTVASGANLTLAPGGVFSATTDRTITINGSGHRGLGRHQPPDRGRRPGVGLHPGDRRLDAELRHRRGRYAVTAGLWTNDYRTTAVQGPGYINGGSISLSAEPRQLFTPTDANGVATSATPIDISGSILLDGPKNRRSMCPQAATSPPTEPSP